MPSTRWKQTPIVVWTIALSILYNVATSRARNRNREGAVFNNQVQKQCTLRVEWCTLQLGGITRSGAKSRLFTSGSRRSSLFECQWIIIHFQWNLLIHELAGFQQATLKIQRPVFRQV